MIEGNDFLVKRNACELGVPWIAAGLRRVFGGWQHVRGVPRLLYWSRRWVFSSGVILVDTPDGLPLTITPNDYGQLMLFYFPYCPELRALLADVLQPGDVCMDLGANVGVLTVAMAQLVGERGKVIAVEPNPVVTRLLLNTVNHCYLEQVCAVQAGIAGEVGTGRLVLPPGGFSQSVEVSETSDAGDAVDLITIDALIEELTPGRAPDFIKVDIEGSEVELLESMEKLLAGGARPMLLVEFHPEKCLRRGSNAETIRKRLWEMDYSERRIERAGAEYRLCYDSLRPVDHENLLFATQDHLRKRPKLAACWRQGNRHRY